jgi:hypothetical protein
MKNASLPLRPQIRKELPISHDRPRHEPIATMKGSERDAIGADRRLNGHGGGH